jgi:hypothetical protein
MKLFRLAWDYAEALYIAWVLNLSSEVLLFVNEYVDVQVGFPGLLRPTVELTD